MIFVAVLVVAAALVGARYQNVRVPLDHIESPSFARLPPASPADAARAFDTHLKRPSGIYTMEHFLPGQTGNLWISLLVLLVAGIDYRRPLLAGRNLDMVVAQLPGWFLLGSIDMFESAERYADPNYREIVRLVFDGVVLATLALLARQLWRIVRPDTWTWAPSIDARVVAVVATFTLAVSTMMPFLHRPDDSTYFTDLGGQRLRERGMLPYGDPLLTGTPGAAYAPLMYLAQAAAQTFSGEPTNAQSPDLPTLGDSSQYFSPSQLPAQLLLATSQLIASVALFLIGRRWGGEALGLTLVALYNGSAYVLGVGGADDLVGGMTYVSHIVPPAVTLVAFALIDRPLWAGVGLAAAAGFGFYPAFMFPAWLGFQWGRARADGLRFALGFGATAAAISAWVLVASRPAPPLALIATIVRDTLGHHTDPAGYGSSPFGLWGQQTGLLAWMLQPMAGGSALTSPFFLLFSAFLLWTGVRAVSIGPVGLAVLTAATAIGANIWKIHATASYVTWYYPFVLIGTLGPANLLRRAAGRPSAHEGLTEA